MSSAFGNPCSTTLAWPTPQTRSVRQDMSAVLAKLCYVDYSRVRGQRSCSNWGGGGSWQEYGAVVGGAAVLGPSGHCTPGKRVLHNAAHEIITGVLFKFA
jgi:hypothetical protein